MDEPPTKVPSPAMPTPEFSDISDADDEVHSSSSSEEEDSDNDDDVYIVDQTEKVNSSNCSPSSR